MSLDLSDSRFHFSQTPSVAEFESDPANRTTCPHPECLSNTDGMKTRVKVEGGEDYCIHHCCTWTENDGEHFARDRLVIPNGRDVPYHILKALDKAGIVYQWEEDC